VIEIEGKQVLTSLDELVAPRHVALLLIDLQKDFLDPDGAFGRMGIDQTMYPPMRATTATLLAASVIRRHRSGSTPAYMRGGAPEGLPSGTPRSAATAISSSMRRNRFPPSRSSKNGARAVSGARTWIWSFAATAWSQCLSPGAPPRAVSSPPPGTRCSTTTTWSSWRTASQAMTGNSMRRPFCSCATGSTLPVQQIYLAVGQERPRYRRPATLPSLGCLRCAVSRSA